MRVERLLGARPIRVSRPRQRSEIAEARLARGKQQRRSGGRTFSSYIDFRARYSRKPRRTGGFEERRKSGQRSAIGQGYVAVAQLGSTGAPLFGRVRPARTAVECVDIKYIQAHVADYIPGSLAVDWLWKDSYCRLFVVWSVLVHKDERL